MRLDPPELGELRILMRRGDGGIDVRIHAKSGVTLEMLLSRGEEIERVLQSLNVDIHSIQFESMSSGGADDNPFASSDNPSGLQDEQEESADDERQTQRKQQVRRWPAQVTSLLSFRA